MAERIYDPRYESKIMSADEAAKLINDGDVIAVSGFTSVGNPKAVPLALAKRGEAGEKIGVTLITGASVTDELDGALARSGVLKRRYPYQSHKDVRALANSGAIHYQDQHLGSVPYMIRQKVYGDINVAIIEAVALDEKGIWPAASGGISNTAVKYADKVIIEINTALSENVKGMHDFYDIEPLPDTKPIPLCKANDRIGTPYIPCTPDKVAAVVYSDFPYHGKSLPAPDDVMKNIAKNLIEVLEKEVAKGGLPVPLPPMQSGVGGVANAVLVGLADSSFEDLTVFTEVMQDSVLDLIDAGKVKFVSTASMPLSTEYMAKLFDNIDKYKDNIIIRPQDISNNPEVIRRLGLIAMNTALEADITGNVNSTHVNGRGVMNGLGGSNDFARNAAITIFTTGSTAKNGEVSCIVPHCSHIDHTEHDVQFIITEWGAADIRGLDPYEKAELIIEKCAHPKFRPELRAYLEKAKNDPKRGHGIPSDL